MKAMNDFAAAVPEKRQELFSKTASTRGLSEALVEKDFWVCWVLGKIFGSQDLKECFVFKGGTSLSKGYKIIQRFSEDVDLVLSWDHLSESLRKDLENLSVDIPRNQRDRKCEEVRTSTSKFVKDEIVPMLKETLEAIDNVQVQLVDAQSKESQVIVSYPRAFDSGHIRPEILLEISAISSSVPSEEKRVSPFVAEDCPDLFAESESLVKMILAKRTFWDKATILHQQANSDTLPVRYSRHYYDLYMMSNTYVLKDAIDDKELRKGVVEWKTKYFYSASARYEKAVPGTFKLVPAEEKLKALEKDYAQMKEMIFGTPPQWQAMVACLREVEGQINSSV